MIFALISFSNAATLSKDTAREIAYNFHLSVFA